MNESRDPFRGHGDLHRRLFPDPPPEPWLMRHFNGVFAFIGFLGLAFVVAVIIIAVHFIGKWW